MRRYAARLEQFLAVLAQRLKGRYRKGRRLRGVGDEIGTWRKSSCLLAGAPPKACRDEQGESGCARDPASPVRPSPNGGSSAPGRPQNRCHQAITSLRDGLDVGRPIRIVSKRFPQLYDDFRKPIVTPHDTRPT